MLASDDPDMLLDLRINNGRASDSKFEKFYDEVQKYFDEQLMAVHERRQGSELYLPLAISLEDLRREVAKRLPEGTPMPCTETLRLQFYPSHALHKTAEKYTGRFPVQFKVQSRLSRIHHVDFRYAATLYNYVKI